MFKTEKSIFSNAITHENLVIFGCHDFNLYCLDQNSGNLVWIFKCDSEIYSTPFCIEKLTPFKSLIIAISCNGTIYIINAKTGQPLLCKNEFFNNLKNSCYSSPIVHQNNLFIGCRDNYMYSINLT